MAKHDVVNDPTKWKNCEFCDYVLFKNLFVVVVWINITALLCLIQTTTHSDDLLFHVRRVHTGTLCSIEPPLLPPKTEEKPADAKTQLASCHDHESNTKVTQPQDEELAKVLKITY